MNTSVTTLVLVAAVLVWILYRQTQVKAVKEQRPYLIMLILGAVGLVETIQLGSQVSIPVEGYVFMVVGLASGALFGLLRGSLLHVWRSNGVLMRKGNWVTIALWIVGLAIHLGLDQVATAMAPAADRGFTETLGSASIPLYLGIALAAQRFALLAKARRLEGSSTSVYSTSKALS